MLVFVTLNLLALRPNSESEANGISSGPCSNLQASQPNSQVIKMFLDLKHVSISYRILHGRCTAVGVGGRAPVVADNSPGSSHIASNTCHYEFPPPVLRP